jgi:hypothetical protein
MREIKTGMAGTSPAMTAAFSFRLQDGGSVSRRCHTT